MILMTADVFGRNLFNTPIRGVIEIVSLSIVSIVFIQLADTLRTGKFTRADAVLGALLLQRPTLGRFLQGVFHLAGAALLATMCFASWSLLAEFLAKRRISRRDRRFSSAGLGYASRDRARIGLYRGHVLAPGIRRFCCRLGVEST